MTSYRLVDFCKSKKVSLDSEFVGIHYLDGKFEIVFPLGFTLPKTEKKENEKLLKNDILLLISTLRRYKNDDRQNRKGENFEKQDFPLSAYLFVFNYFLKHGYYREKEILFKKNAKGKVNWSRTIKQTKPAVNNGNVVYLDLIARKTNFSEDELLSKINRFCVYESFEKIGCFFTSYKLKNPHIKCQAKLFVSFLKKKIAQTFNDEDRMLFKNMLAIINRSENSKEGKEYFWGTNEFHFIWESLVDKTFGESDKEKFYPKVYWKLFDENGNLGSSYDFSGDEKRNSLRPDTIMILNRGKTGQKIFVLDSKYYRYGVTKIKNHLPASESIVKQLAYAKYIEKDCWVVSTTSTGSGQAGSTTAAIPNDVKAHVSKNSIFNAFIMPADLQGENFKMKKIGFASADFVFEEDENEEEKSWHKIYGILIDTKFLMENATKNDKLAAELAEVIGSFASEKNPTDKQ